MSVSVIIKTLNEEKNIARTVIHAFAALPDGLGEVIVADGGSSDATVEIALAHGARVVQLVAPAKPSCGIGPQLGYQYARGEFVCLIDGDMDLDPDFLASAVTWLQCRPNLAGVTGHIEEMSLDMLEYAHRNRRAAPEKRAGPIDRMNGGGLYRAAALRAIGYMGDRNLHAYEEYELGVRLRHAGYRLHRLDRRFVRHYGHRTNSYRLLLRRWKQKYLFGLGEVLRASIGKPWFFQVLKDLPEIRLWALVGLWLLLSLGLVVALPDKLLAIASVLAVFAGLVALMSWRRNSLSLGLYAVVAWIFHAVALPFGFFQPRRDPKAPIESRRIGFDDDRISTPAGTGGHTDDLAARRRAGIGGFRSRLAAGS